MYTTLIDTNVLIYIHDRSAFDKQLRAINLIDYLQPTGRTCLSTQTIAEFYHATTKGRHPMLPAAQAALQAREFAQAFAVLDVTPQIVLEALRGAQEHRMPYWDAQLWATAKLNQVPVLFSENFNPGATIEGVRFVDPFADGFAVEEWA